MIRQALLMVGLLGVTAGVYAQKAATASSNESVSRSAAMAVDGDSNTRWASRFKDDEWIRIDQGESKTVAGVKLAWETAFGKEYKIQVSNDGVTWTDVYEQKNGKGGKETVIFTQPQQARYVQMLGVKRGTQYGYSLYEFDLISQAGPKGKQATASSSENNKLTADFSVDGDGKTRWSSIRTDDEWIMIDQGETKTVTGVVLLWEAAYAKEYKIQVSNDGMTWTDVYEQKDGKGGKETIKFTQPQQARYVKMQGVKRGTQFGYSLYEFDVLTQ